MDDIIIYHGSRGGIKGKISPNKSRIRCDFGKGFYMGESVKQVKSLILEDSFPIVYTIRLKLSEIPDNKILILSDEEWLYAVLANRRIVDSFDRLKVAKQWRKKLDKYDIVIGPIADDRMNEAMTRFSDFALSDVGLKECLKSVEYGNQYVAKSEFACSKIEIIDEESLQLNEINNLRKYTYQKRNESRNIVQRMSIKYRRKGKYLDEIIENEREKEREEYEL